MQNPAEKENKALAAPGLGAHFKFTIVDRLGEKSWTV